MTGAWTAGMALLDAGGFVMPWLVGGAFALWTALGWRASLLLAPARSGTVAQLVARERRQPSPHPPVAPRDHAVHAAVAAAGEGHRPPRATIDEALSEVRGDLGRGRVLVRTLVVLAPLAGLLGTVTGMIETFRSLADMALFTQGGGIAGGIAEALLTTQMGLAVAVPGLVVGRALDRREATVHADLDLLTELVTAAPRPSALGVPAGAHP